jgi:hypothetical protein
LYDMALTRAWSHAYLCLASFSFTLSAGFTSSAASTPFNDFTSFILLTFSLSLHFLERIRHQALGFDEVKFQSALGSAITGIFYLSPEVRFLCSQVRHH